jgi:hypothetical protein
MLDKKAWMARHAQYKYETLETSDTTIARYGYYGYQLEHPN